MVSLSYKKYIILYTLYIEYASERTFYEKICFGIFAYLERKRKMALYYVVLTILQVVCIILRIMMIVRGG